MPENEVYKALEQYRRWGLSVIPIGYKSKKPFIEWKQYQRRQPDNAEVGQWCLEYWGDGNQANIGIVCGKVSGNFVALDFDNPGERWESFQRTVQQRLGKSIYELTPVVRTSRGFQVYLRTRRTVNKQRLPGALDIQGEGSYVVAPPSIHPTGAVYHSLNPGVTEILEVGSLSELGVLLQAKTQANQGDGSWVIRALQGVSEGERDNTCIRLAGHYKAKGLGRDETMTLLKGWAGKCSPPFPDREVEKCVNSSYGYLEREARTQAEALAEARRVTLKWLKLGDADVIDVALASVVANKADGDPLWVLMVGAPSTGKSEILRGLFGCSNVQPLGGFTANTFASGFEKVKAGLLESLPDHTTLVIKDFGSLLSMRREDRAIVLQQLREIYDGQYRKDYGNGKVVEWEGTMGLLAACTSAIENYHAVIGELGNRYVLYRCELEEDARETVALKALSDEGVEDAMREEIGAAFKNAMDNAPDSSRVGIPEHIQQKLASLASLVAQCRSQVSRDAYDKTVNYVPDIEGPARLVKAFAKLGKALAAVRGRAQVTEEEYKAVMKVALDTMPKRRRVIIRCLTDGSWKGTKETGNAVDMPTGTVGRELEDLALVKVVSRDLDLGESEEARQTTPYRWRLKDSVAGALETTGILQIL